MTTEERLLDFVLAERQQLIEDRRSFEKDKDRFERWLSFVANKMAENSGGGYNGNGRGGLMTCTGRQSFGRLVDGVPTILWENDESKAERVATNGAS